jgi:hypothetical protein
MVTKEAIEKARQRARAIFEAAHYDGVCTVTEHQKVKNERSKVTEFVDVVVLSDQPCHLSFETIAKNQESESASNVTQTTKLFIAPELTIKAGSKITVTQCGITTDYTHSGVPAVYDTHQEIILDLFEKWS